MTKEVDRLKKKTAEINQLTAEVDNLKRSSRLFKESAADDILFLNRRHEREISYYNETLASKDEQLKQLRELLDVYRALDNVKNLIDLGQPTKRAREGL